MSPIPAKCITYSTLLKKFDNFLSNLVKSALRNLKFLLFDKCFILCKFPPDRLSITFTLKPLLRKRSVVWLPINPAPPVIRTVDFLLDYFIFF